MNKRLKQAREGLNLSQDFVAEQLGVTTADVAAIENGTHKITENELSTFSKLYGITREMLLHGDVSTEQAFKTLGKPVRALSGNDKKDVFDMLRFRQIIRETGYA